MDMVSLSSTDPTVPPVQLKIKKAYEMQQSPDIHNICHSKKIIFLNPLRRVAHSYEYKNTLKTKGPIQATGSYSPTSEVRTATLFIMIDI